MPAIDATRLPSVSVIVPAIDAEAQVADCVRSLLASDYPATLREILLVDAGSTDSTVAIARRYPIRVLEVSGRNISHARNTGIDASTGDIVVFTDTDCVVSARWLRGLVDAFEDASVGVVAGAIVPFPPGTMAERYAARRRSHSQTRPLEHPRHAFAMTPNVALRRDAFRQVGLFDSRFPGGGWEDADLCWRVTRATGLRMRYAPSAVVFHRYRATVGEFAVQHYRYGYGLGVISRKYGDELDAEWATVSGMGRDVAGACGALMGAAVRWGLRRADALEVGFCYLDLVRHVAQRSGYLRAAFSSPIGLSS